MDGRAQRVRITRVQVERSTRSRRESGHRNARWPTGLCCLACERSMQLLRQVRTDRESRRGRHRLHEHSVMCTGLRWVGAELMETAQSRPAATASMYTP